MGFAWGFVPANSNSNIKMDSGFRRNDEARKRSSPWTEA
ncbi:hypothetical protein GLE_3975 [Lysobacter enzymogenes]|uniref:Uncharacterized protein n=1 Tax=Lysobacter enzymogenes TaxID=69 RepID=A0A0S2DL65_LYSEN|nr:hypothetical protein GLE_3975 [Lysobacter enzymogenes]